jgi:hypothetical protein
LGANILASGTSFSGKTHNALAFRRIPNGATKKGFITDTGTACRVTCKQTLNALAFERIGYDIIPNKGLDAILVTSSIGIEQACDTLGSVRSNATKCSSTDIQAVITAIGVDDAQDALTFRFVIIIIRRTRGVRCGASEKGVGTNGLTAFLACTSH